MFISVKEAVELTGKSQTTIYRLCKKRIRTEYVKVEGSQYLIDKEFLLETYPFEKDEDDLISIEVEGADNEDNTIIDNVNVEDDSSVTEEDVDRVKVIADSITERITKNATDNFKDIPLTDKSSFNFEKLSYWETIIGLSVSVLLITGFILMLYFNTK